MAFRLNFVADMEYRGCQTGVSSNTGKQWMSIKLEDEDANSVDVSVPADLQGEVLNQHLRRGQSYRFALRAVAYSDGGSFVQLRACPERIGVDDTTLDGLAY